MPLRFMTFIILFYFHSIHIYASSIVRNTMINHQAINKLSGAQTVYWRIAQTLSWFLGLCILVSLLLFPTLGLHAFWNVLITIAPALFVVAVGLWRNICPLASVSLLPRHLGMSKKKRIPIVWQGRLYLISVLVLLFMLPWRQLILNNSGLATASVIIAISIIALITGFIFDWKSGWCSGLCPIHPVEKLYGSKVSFTMPNAHCTSCKQCVVPCPDSTGGVVALKEKKTIYHRLAGMLIIGGFPGFIWGWFHVPSFQQFEGWNQLIIAYGFPLLGLLVSMLIYGLVQLIFSAKHEIIITRFFATASIACYYWYRLPAIIGFGLFPEDGRLIDLSLILPNWIPLLIIISTTIFFAWWIIIRPEGHSSWLIRPPFETKARVVED